MWPARKERVNTSASVRLISFRTGSAAAGVRAYSLFKTTGPNTGAKVRIVNGVTALKRIRAP